MQEFKETKVNREIKDAVFKDLFSDPQNQAELVGRLHPEEKVAPDDVKLMSLEQVLLRGIYNDLGILFKDTLIVLMEA